MPRARQSLSSNNSVSSIPSSTNGESVRRSARANHPRMDYRSMADPSWSQIVKRAHELAPAEGSQPRRQNWRLEFSSILHVDLKRPCEKRELQRKYPQLRKLENWSVPLCSNFSCIDGPCEIHERYREGQSSIKCVLEKNPQLRWRATVSVCKNLDCQIAQQMSRRHQSRIGMRTYNNVRFGWFRPVPCARLCELDVDNEEDEEENADLLAQALHLSGIPTIEQLEGTSGVSSSASAATTYTATAVADEHDEELIDLFGDGLPESALDSELWTPRKKRRAGGRPAKSKRVPPTRPLVALPSAQQPPQTQETIRKQEESNALDVGGHGLL